MVGGTNKKGALTREDAVNSFRCFHFFFYIFLRFCKAFDFVNGYVHFLNIRTCIHVLSLAVAITVCVKIHVDDYTCTCSPLYLFVYMS